ncbi:MAG: hypothetical protein PVI79_06550 [Gammaproteobacteria bacterium]|jgi:hypothetical protein
MLAIPGRRIAVITGQAKADRGFEYCGLDQACCRMPDRSRAPGSGNLATSAKNVNAVREASQG